MEHKNIIQRDSNIELLRIFAMMGVIILHFINENIGGGISYVQDDTLKTVVINVEKTLFISAVDLFLMISGYFNYKKEEIQIIKPIKLIIQVVFFQFLIYGLNIIVGNEQLRITSIIGCLIPVNYYVIMYVALFLISPYINKLCSSLDDRSIRRLVILVVVIFSVYPTLVGILEHIQNRQYEGLSTISIQGDQSGYNIVNFLLCYLIGVYARRIKKRNKKWIYVILIGSYILNLTWGLMGYCLNIKTSAYKYSNPIVLIMSLSLLLLFAEIKIGYNNIVNWLAKISFTVFLTHIFFLKFFPIEIICKSSIWIMLLCMNGISILIYLACIPFYYCFELFYHIIEKMLLKIPVVRNFQVKS